MKKLNVILKDELTLELLESGEPGDIINLREVIKVDTKFIDELIQKEKNKEYQKLLEVEKKLIDAKNALEVQELKNKNDLLKQIYEREKDELRQKLLDEQKENYDKLMIEINNQKLLLEKQKTELEYSKKEALNNLTIEEERKYNLLKQKYDLIKSEFDQQVNNKEIELDSKHKKEVAELLAKNEIIVSQMKVEQAIQMNEQKEYYQQEILKKDEIINNLQRQKSLLNVKQTGEDLETWCDNEVTMYMQNGLFNCKWYKDNNATAGDGEEGKTKADFIFEVYATDEKNEEELLTNICLEMKDENPTSKTKKTNSSHYSKLNKDRINKGCKYAVLVSNLEMDKSNIIPIFKVNEYENMYVVRPGYLMVFLNMVTSLTKRFADLYLSDKKVSIELMEKQKIIDAFDTIKKKFLDKPLNDLEKNLSNIISCTEKIKSASDSIE